MARTTAVACRWHGLSRTAGAKTFGDPFWILPLNLLAATPARMAWLQRLTVSAEIPRSNPGLGGRAEMTLVVAMRHQGGGSTTKGRTVLFRVDGWL